MFLTIRRSWADHDTACHADAVSGMEKGDDRWPETASHNRIDFRQTLTFEQPGDLPPALIRL
jgi:hypothetical protein